MFGSFKWKIGTVSMVVLIGSRSQLLKAWTIRKIEPENPKNTTKIQKNLEYLFEFEMWKRPWIVEDSKNSLKVSILSFIQRVYSHRLVNVSIFCLLWPQIVFFCLIIIKNAWNAFFRKSLFHLWQLYSLPLLMLWLDGSNSFESSLCYLLLLCLKLLYWKVPNISSGLIILLINWFFTMNIKEHW